MAKRFLELVDIMDKKQCSDKYIFKLAITNTTTRLMYCMFENFLYLENFSRGTNIPLTRVRSLENVNPLNNNRSDNIPPTCRYSLRSRAS